MVQPEKYPGGRQNVKTVGERSRPYYYQKKRRMMGDVNTAGFNSALKGILTSRNSDRAAKPPTLREIRKKNRPIQLDRRGHDILLTRTN